MDREAGEPSAVSQDVQQLVGKIHRHCKKIRVAKKESLQLTNLCSDLIKHLSDRSLILRQSDHKDVKRNLALIEGKLAGWSKYSYAKSLMKESEIESGVSGCVKQLISAIPQREGAGEGTASAVTEIGHNKVRFNEPLPSRTAKHGTRESQPVEVNEMPLVKRLDGEVVRQGEIPFAGGMYYEVWVGQWKKGTDEVGGEKVEKVSLKAIKTLESREGALKKLERELSTWAGLHHLNVLPFYGIVTDIRPHLYMVSPWQENGHLLTYVKNDPRPKKDYLLRGAAGGLSYLHSRGIIHGNVKCKNVLISHEGEPLICDFAIARIVEEMTESTISKTVSSGGIVRYLAIELIEDPSGRATMNSDTYSFAMLILECITEEAPFSSLSRDQAVVHARVAKRQSPPRPGTRLEDSKDPENLKNCVSDELWDLMTRCWSEKPEDRPTMEYVHRFFADHTR